VSPERDGDAATYALLIALAAAKGQDRALGLESHVGYVQPDDLTSAETTGEAEEDDRFVPGALSRVR
jgi:hypothetical protein